MRLPGGNRKMGMIKTCNTCKKEINFPLWKIKIRKNKKTYFCSKRCWINRDSAKKICKTCKKIFRRRESSLKRNKSGNYYCSRECRYKDPDSYFKNGKLILCQTCKKAFYKTKSKNQKYCSIKCRSKNKRYCKQIGDSKKKRYLVNCKNCGKNLLRSKCRLNRNKNHFCSIACRAKEDKGKISPKRNGKTVGCIYCGKKVYRARHRLEQYKHQYCSKSCMNKHLIFMYIRPTTPEKRFMGLINKHNLPYKYVGDGKFWIDNKNPDFIHINKKEVIEIFGDYWHNPQLNKHCKYENTEEGRQKVFKAKGFKCIIIWEKELNKPNWEKDILKKIGANYANICSPFSQGET